MTTEKPKLSRLQRWVNRFEKDAPSHAEKHQLILEELANILGPQYVSDDRGVAEAYTRDYLAGRTFTKGRAEFVVLPGSTEDVQRVVRLANRLNFPFSIMSVGMNVTCWAAQGVPYWCQIDPKRMDHLEIDQKNMFAVVQPYVTHGQLQIEAMKVGLFNAIPSAGLNSSCMANNIAFGIQSSMYRTGHGGKNILGAEIVLPNGEIVRTGALATPGAGYFWGEGPGPDGRALIRGLSMHAGSLGVVTRIAIKLFPWPGPRVWPMEGPAPNHIVKLPRDRFRFYFYIYPTLKEVVEVMREISKAEICGTLHRWAVWQMASFCHKSREQRWGLWTGGHWERVLGSRQANILTVGIYGWTSPKQVEYEEQVLKHIIEKTGGKPVPDEVFQTLEQYVGLDSIKTDAATRHHRTGHGPYLGGGELQTLTDVLRELEEIQRLQVEYTPPLMDTGFPAWVAPIDFGHFANLEVYGAVPERGEKAEATLLPAIHEDLVRQLDDKIMSVHVSSTPMNQTGPSFANLHHITAKIKNAFDPKWVACPTRFIDMEAMASMDEVVGTPEGPTTVGN